MSTRTRESTSRTRGDLALVRAGHPRYSAEEIMGLELRRYLTRVYRARKREHLAIGSLDGWARAICYVSARVDQVVSMRSAVRHCQRVGIDIPDAILKPVIAEFAAAKAARALSFSPALVGEMLQLTAAEREEHGIRRLIDACDQTAEERRKERARQRSAKRRSERGVKPRSQSAEVKKPWNEAGVSRRTWYRQRQKLALKRHMHPTKKIQKKSRRDVSVPSPSERDEKVPVLALIEGGRK